MRLPNPWLGWRRVLLSLTWNRNRQALGSNPHGACRYPVRPLSTVFAVSRPRRFGCVAIGHACDLQVADLAGGQPVPQARGDVALNDLAMVEVHLHAQVRGLPHLSSTTWRWVGSSGHALAAAAALELLLLVRLGFRPT